MTGAEGQPPQTGSLGEEAVKLLQAVQEWAKESGHEYGDTLGAAANGAAGMFSGVNEHIATGGRDCRYCPVCRMISAARATSPEVKQHLTSAASSLLQAAAGYMESHGPERHEPRADGAMERIDLSDDEWEDD